MNETSRFNGCFITAPKRMLSNGGLPARRSASSSMSRISVIDCESGQSITFIYGGRSLAAMVALIPVISTVIESSSVLAGFRCISLVTIAQQLVVVLCNGLIKLIGVFPSAGSFGKAVTMALDMLDLLFKVVGSVPVASITPSIPTKGTPAK
jgi:hypothetical protein